MLQLEKQKSFYGFKFGIFELPHFSSKMLVTHYKDNQLIITLTFSHYIHLCCGIKNVNATYKFWEWKYVFHLASANTNVSEKDGMTKNTFSPSEFICRIFIIDPSHRVCIFDALTPNDVVHSNFIVQFRIYYLWCIFKYIYEHSQHTEE